MDQRERKRQGPIGWLIGLYRDDPHFAQLLLITALVLGWVFLVILLGVLGVI